MIRENIARKLNGRLTSSIHLCVREGMKERGREGERKGEIVNHTIVSFVHFQLNKYYKKIDFSLFLHKYCAKTARYYELSNSSLIARINKGAKNG